jgi:hypothetical protein
MPKLAEANSIRIGMRRLSLAKCVLINLMPRKLNGRNGFLACRSELDGFVLCQSYSAGLFSGDTYYIRPKI